MSEPHNQLEINTDRSEFDRELIDFPQQPYKNIPTLLYYIMIICLGPVYYGWVVAQFSGIPDSCLNQTYGTIATQSVMYGVLEGIFTFGGIFGAAAASPLIKCFTRKKFILLVNAFIIISIAIAQIPNVYALLVSRICMGFFAGFVMAIVPIYINDLCPKQIAGKYGVFTGLMLMFGVLLSFTFSSIFTVEDAPCQPFWRLSFGLPAVFIILQTILLITNQIPESPNSLVMAGKIDQAKEILEIFYKKQYVDEAMKEKITDVQIEQGTYKPKIGLNEEGRQLEIKLSRWVYILAFEIPLFSQLCGVNSISLEIGVIIKQYDQNLGNYLPILVNVAQAIGYLLAIPLNAKIGRKPIILISNLLFVILNIILAVLFIYIKDWEPAVILIAIIAIIYMFLFGFTIGPITWLYIPEIVPAHIVPFATMTSWFGSTVTLAITPIITDAFDGNPYAVFFIWAAFSLVFFIMNFLLVVQTKNLSKEEVAEKFRLKFQ